MKRNALTNTEIILQVIKGAGGLRFTEIQEIAARLAGLDWNERDENGRFRYRGFWCTRLLGGPFYGVGVLHKFCRKGKDGKWRVVKPIEPPFFSVINWRWP